MTAKFLSNINRTLDFEGKLSDDPVDPGGITNYGISIVFLTKCGEIDPDDGYLIGDMNHDGRIDRADILAMTVVEATKIYYGQWWARYGYERITNSMVAWKIFDLAVNMGSVRSHMIAQTAAGDLAVDGNLGLKSLARINSLPPEPLLNGIRLGAKNFYLGLIAKKPAFEKYRRGWLRRAEA